MKRLNFSRLQDWRAHTKRKALLLLGARQVGKTFLLKEFGAAQFPRAHFVNFETMSSAHQAFAGDLSPEAIISDLALLLGTRIEVASDLIVFDEIQECPRALTSLKYFSEASQPFYLCSAGSLLGLSLTDESFPVGKVSHLDCFPMTFGEFLRGVEDVQGIEAFENGINSKKISEVAHEHLWQQFKRYLIVGGLPEIVDMYRLGRSTGSNILQLVRQRQTELIINYIADMAKHAGKANSMQIERVWSNVPQQLMRVQDSTSDKFKFKNVVPGVNAFERLAPAVDWLVKTKLVHPIKIISTVHQPLSVYASENSFKLMMFDVGVLGAMAGLAPETIWNYDFGTYKGFLAENFVAQELAAGNHSPLYSWRSGQSEIEFLLSHGARIVPLEVKSGNRTRSKSMSVYIEKHQPEIAIKASARNLKYERSAKTLHIPLYMIGSWQLLVENWGQRENGN